MCSSPHGVLLWHKTATQTIETMVLVCGVEPKSHFSLEAFIISTFSPSAETECFP